MSEFFNFNQEDAVFNNLMSDDMQSDINVNNNLEANLETDLAQQPIDPPGKPSSFAKAIELSNEKLFNSLAQPEPAELKGSAIKTVSPESIEKFQAQEWYDPLNFNPLAYDTNMQKAIEKETWGTALAKGFDQFFYNAGNTFTGWFSDYGKMFDAVANFDWDALKPTESELMTQYYEDQKKMNENYVFVPQEDEDGIFNKKFFAEFLGNVGYTYGTISALGLELAADFLITGFTGGAGIETFGATAARALSKIGIKKAAKEGVEAAAKASLFRRTMAGYELADKSTDAIAPIVRATTQAEIAAAYRIPSNVAKETFNSYLNLFSNNLLNISKSKTAFELAGNIMKGLPLVGTGLRYGENIAEAARAGAGLAELTGMGLKGLRRVSQELNMAISEASFESVSSYGDTLDGLVKDYQNKNNGQLPDVETFNEMRDYAVKASSSNYDTNTAILLASNKLQFGNLFNKFVPANKALLSLQDAMVDRTVAQVAKRGAFKLYDKSGLFGTYGIIGKVASDFGKKEAAKMIGKSMFRNFVQFEVVEGAQEIVQEASASAWKNYYTNQFNKNTEYTLSDAFGEGFKEQYSKQGLKTFLMGALTGTLVKGPSKVLNNLATKTQEAYYNNKYGKDGVDNPIVQHRENLKKDIDAINAVFAKGGPGSFSSKLFNFNTQLNSTNEMDEAASKGMQYEFENGKDNALLSATLSAYRTNTSKGFINAIREMGIDMTNEEFKSEFGIDLADTKYSTAAEFSNSVADKMQKYSDTIEAIRTNAKNKFVDPYDYEEKTVDRNIAIDTRKAQEEAVYVLAMNAIKADMTAERLAQLGNDLRNIPGLKNSSDYAMRVLTDPKTLGGELRLLQTRLAQLESADTTGFTPELIQENKKQIKEIQEEIKLLTEWAGLWKGRAEVTGKATDTGIVFVGKEINKKQRVKDANGKTIWEPTVTYNPKDKKVAELFRKIVNLKNSQFGLETLLSQVDLNESFDKIADYIQLDRDTKDYLDAVEVLSEPSRFMEIIKYSEEGLFKYKLESAIGSLVNSYGKFATNLASSITKDKQEAFSIAQTIFNTIHDKVTNSNEYNSLVAIITDPNSNLDNYKESYILFQKLQNIVSLETYKFIKEYMPEEYKNDVTTEELDEALTGNLSDFRELSIAEKILNNEQLTENEQKIYDDPKLKEVIDDLVQDLKSTGYESSTELIENEDGTVNIVDKRTGEIINEQPLSQEEAESLKEQIDATENQDPVSVAASEELDQSQKAPANLDEEFATASQGVEEDYTQSNDEILKQFLNYSDSEKIKFLEQVRSFKPEYKALIQEYKALRQALGKGQISKEQYEQQVDVTNQKVDVINQNTFILGAEDFTLKSLLSKFKLENTNNDTQVGTAPTTPAVTAQEIKAQPTAPTAPVSDKKTDIEKEIFSKTDNKGRTFTYYSNTKEKDGKITINFSFNRSDKDSSQRANAIMGIPVEYALEDKYNIDEEYIPEGAKVVGVSEIRITKEGVGATVTFEVDGEKYQGDVKLNSNTTYDAELTALKETQPTQQPVEEVKPQGISMVVANTPYEIINNEVFYNGQPIGLDLKLSVDVSTMSPFDVIKLHLKQKEKEAKSKKTVLSKQLKDLIKLQEEINAESVDPVAEEVVEENITPQQDTEIDEAREVVIERVIEEELDDETRSLIAEEENVSEDQVDRIIADAVADVVDNNKKGLFDKLGDSAKKFVKKILIIISALTISGFALYSGPGQSLVKNIFLETQEVVTPDEEITFTTSSFNVTPLEGCSAYVNNQVRAVIGKKGQEAINLFGHAWTSSYNMVNTGRGKFIFNIFDNYKKPANIKTSSQINAEIKKLVNKAGTITESQLQEGDIVSMYYENSLASEEAWTNGKGTYITHVGIVKRNSDGKLVVEDNIHGIIRNYTVEDLNASKIESRAGGKIRIAAVARPDYKLANKKIKPYAPAKELSTSNTPIKKNKPLQAAGLFGIGLLLRRKKDEGQDISTELQNEIDKLKLEIDNVNTTVKDIKNNLKSLSDAIYYYEQNFKPVVAKPAKLTPKQLALQESLIREMVKPNGKLINEFTSEEQDLINQADVSLKQKLQKEEQAAYDAKQKVQDDYKPFNNVSEEDLDDNISELFATPDKIDNTKRNREFSKKYLKTEEESLIIPFITDVLQALNDYNKKNKTELETVEDFVKFSKTKAIAEDIKNNLLATQATSTEDVKQVLDDSELGDNFSELLGEDVVEVTEPTSTEVDSNNKETLNTNFINSLVKDFQESKDKNSKNNAKFVEKDSIQSLLNDINDITNCL